MPMLSGALSDSDADFYSDDFDDEEEMCPDCLGDGMVLTCCDDICHGQGFCMHGDGEEPCPTCGGEGYV